LPSYTKNSKVEHNLTLYIFTTSAPGCGLASSGKSQYQNLVKRSAQSGRATPGDPARGLFQGENLVNVGAETDRFFWYWSPVVTRPIQTARAQRFLKSRAWAVSFQQQTGSMVLPCGLVLNNGWNCRPLEVCVMRCPSCNFENSRDKRFCLQCGFRLEGRCPQCGAENPSGARFCGDCGAALGDGAAVKPRQVQTSSSGTLHKGSVNPATDQYVWAVRTRRARRPPNSCGSTPSFHSKSKGNSQ